MKKIKVGIMGLGTVGGGVVKILQKRREELCRNLGLDFEIVKISSSRDSRFAELNLSKELFCNNLDDFLKTEMDVVVELIGGSVAAPVMKEALKQGKKVVTANKAYLATKSDEILSTSKSENLYYEASCLGGIPILSIFEEGLLANQIQQITGIFNGTCNFILSEMAAKGLDFAEVLAQAQEKGYAEADPTFDVEGVDATHKLCLMGSLSFQERIPFELIPSRGISSIAPEDFLWAKQNKYCIKLLSLAEKNEQGTYVGTFPALIPDTHPLAGVNGANNAIFIKGDAVGELMFYGPGAGEFPTASAVVSDIIAAGMDRKRSWSQHVFNDCEELKTLNTERLFPHYIRLKAPDQPGILSQLSGELGKRQISLRLIHQNLPGENGEASLTFLTHPTSEKRLQEALAAMKDQNILLSEAMILPVIEA